MWTSYFDRRVFFLTREKRLKKKEKRDRRENILKDKVLVSFLPPLLIPICGAFKLQVYLFFGMGLSYSLEWV